MPNFSNNFYVVHNILSAIGISCILIDYHQGIYTFYWMWDEEMKNVY